jgi:rhodanese-related sulfurtransferase
MEWTLALVPVVLVAAFFLVKRMSFVTAETARQHLAQGALVIDVRSPEEFRSDRVPGAINIPLGELRGSLSRQVKDKQQVLLVHCLSGGRSAIAKWQLKGLGYANVFNLGPLARAHQIVAGAKRK